MKRLLLVVQVLLLSPQRAHSRANCKPVASSFCLGLGYTTTPYPTGAPGFNLQQVAQIVETACSPKVATLMCRVAVPECGYEESSQMKPCRALCDKVKSDCDPLLRAKRLSWPTRLRCDALPAVGCAQGQEVSAPPPAPPQAPPPCQAISVPACMDLPYSDTTLPNVLGHASQEEAGVALMMYMPLIQVGCSTQLKPFLCSLFTPKCVSGATRPPCRAQCEQARAGCESLMNKFGLLWPKAFSCDAFTTESCEDVAPVLVFPRTPITSCQAISVPLCRDLPYRDTVLPNVLGHASQEEAAAAAAQFAPLVKLGCSTHMKTFLCSVYTPECVSGAPRPPCRTLCERALSDCRPLMDKFSFPWPESLKCEAFTTESCGNYGVGSSGGICEPITIPMCQGLSYNQTMFPNQLGHTSQREAVAKMSFFSLAQTMCTVDIRLFVCAAYAPPCAAGEVRRPCRAFCERAQRGCEGFMAGFDVSWPAELKCDSLPEDDCVSEDRRPDTLNAEGLLAKLIAGGYSVRGKTLSLKTARLLLTLTDADKTGDLDVVEVFKLEHHVAVLRREYVESYEGRNPPAVTRAQMKKTLSLREFHLEEETFRALWDENRSAGGIDYDEYVAVLTKLQILRERFQAHRLSLPCDCTVASFSFKQFVKSAII